jgi:Fe-S cluster assembly protein SufD
MAKRVVSTKRAVRRAQGGDFTFTREMVDALNSASPNFYQSFREHAWETYAQLPMPTTRDEPWRRTDLSRLAKDRFHLPNESLTGGLPVVPNELLVPLVGDRHGGQLVLSPGGRADVELDPEIATQGVIFTDLQTAARKHPQIMADILGKVVNVEDGKFAALSAALSPNGILLYVPRGVQVEAPLHSVLWGPGVELAHFSHILIWVEDGASLTYVHETASPPEPGGQTLHGGIVEIQVGAGANLKFVELQSWGEHVWNFTHERARVERDGVLDWIYGGLGTQLTKSFLDLDLNGRGANARMSGFFFTYRNQHFDLDTQQNHLAPNTNSDLLYKGALEGHSRAVWQGMIYVAKDAQNTDGYQANRNLVLSPDARADSIPGLEILADDVRCTHGATVGKIDPELLFYLNSRGIPSAVARRLVVEGFFEPVMQRIPYEGVRDRFQEAIVAKMGFENKA